MALLSNTRAKARAYYRLRRGRAINGPVPSWRFRFSLSPGPGRLWQLARGRMIWCLSVVRMPCDTPSLPISAPARFRRPMPCRRPFPGIPAWHACRTCRWPRLKTRSISGTWSSVLKTRCGVEVKLLRNQFALVEMLPEQKGVLPIGALHQLPGLPVHHVTVSGADLFQFGFLKQPGKQRLLFRRHVAYGVVSADCRTLEDGAGFPLDLERACRFHDSPLQRGRVGQANGCVAVQKRFWL